MTSTAADVLGILRRHYLPEGRPPGGMFLPEIASPCGARRADLIWIPTSMAGIHDGRLIGHEIKVSRSDVVAELKDPTKPDPWAQHCTRWWLVVSHPALIDGLEIPDMWGVMAPPSGRRTRSMTIVRPAPRLTPTADAQPVVTRLAAYTVNRLDTALHARDRRVAGLEREVAHLRASLADAQDGRAFHDSQHARRVSFILRQASDRAHRGGRWVDVRDEDIVAALVDLGAIRGVAEELHRDIERAIKALSTDPAAIARQRLASIAADLSTAGQGRLLDLDTPEVHTNGA